MTARGWMAQVKEILDCNEAHLEKRMGNHEQAKNYCSKLDTRVEGPWEFGSEPNQGKRSDINKMKQLIDEGASEEKLAEENFGLYCKNYKAFDRYKLAKIKPRDFKTEVTWIYGESGCGKSKKAFEMAKEFKSYYYKASSNKWWDGYEGQECVVIDDYKGAWEVEYMLNLLDRYPFRVEIKGGSLWFNSKHIIITSNKRPARYCTDEPKQLLRRIENAIDLSPAQDVTEVPGGNTRPPVYNSDDEIEE